MVYLHENREEFTNAVNLARGKPCVVCDRQVRYY